MDEILIKMQALGYNSDYDEIKKIQKKSVSKDLSSAGFSENDCKAVIEAMISSVNDVKPLYPDEDVPEGNKLVSVSFKIAYKVPGKKALNFDEEKIFKEAAPYDSLAGAMLEYIRATEKGDEGSRVMMPENDEYESHPAGTFAILSLVLRDKKWIADYIDFLRTNDMDSEVMQRWHIIEIIEKYGWCEETSKLAIARNVSCCGQEGKEQFESFVKEGLADYYAVPENRKAFLANIRTEFLSWSNFTFRLEDGDKDYYESDVVSYTNHFEALLSPEEIKGIEEFLLQQWNDYHKN